MSDPAILTIRDAGGYREAQISGSVAAGQTSPPVVIPHPFPAQGVTAAVHPGAGGTMKVQWSCSPRATVEADARTGASNAKWVDWTPGAVSAAQAETFGPVTALRFVAATQTGAYEVLY